MPRRGERIRSVQKAKQAHEEREREAAEIQTQAKEAAEREAAQKEIQERRVRQELKDAVRTIVVGKLEEYNKEIVGTKKKIMELGMTEEKAAKMVNDFLLMKTREADETASSSSGGKGNTNNTG